MAKRTVVLLTAAALSLAACGGGTAAPQAERSSTTATLRTTLTLPPSTTSKPPASSTAGPKTNDRGNILKTFGEQGGLTYADPARGNELAVTFSVDSIKVDPGCPAGGQPAELGHFVDVSFRLATASDAPIQSLLLIYDDWHVVGPDGVRENDNVSPAATFGCYPDSENFPDGMIGPGTQLVGHIVLDSKNTSGSVIFSPSGIQNVAGWEWTF